VAAQSDKEMLPWADFLREWINLAERQGFFVERCGDPELLFCRKGNEGPVVYLSAGIHGDEPAGPWALRGLLEDGFFGEGVQWLICPALNPEKCKLTSLG